MKKNISYIIYVVGVGGTGGNFVKEFCRYVSYLPNEIREQITIIFIDGDKVEEKNCVRQPYFSDNTNQFKADILAEMAGESFGLDILTYHNYIIEKKQLDEIRQTIIKSAYVDDSTISILIGCVDNHRARQVLNEFFENSRNCIYLDSANEYSIGEVVCGSKIKGQVLSPPRSYYYPEILKDNSPNKEEESCQQINISSPQHLVTNLMAANILLKEMTLLISDQVIPEGIIYFDAFKSFMKKKTFSPTEETQDKSNKTI